MFTTTTAQPARRIARPAVAGAAVATTAVIAIRLAPMSFAVIAALAPLIAAAVVDAVERRLPNALVLLSALPVSIVCLFDPFVDRLDALGGVAVGALLLAGPLLAIHLVAPESMGFGDVKAAASLGATLGLIRPDLALWTLCVASAITAGWGVARRERNVALGPGMVLAALAVLLVSALAGIEVTAWH
jgi:leader peptidase (prepilin peptidase)/N-methyltransferase